MISEQRVPLRGDEEANAAAELDQPERVFQLRRIAKTDVS